MSALLNECAHSAIISIEEKRKIIIEWNFFLGSIKATRLRPKETFLPRQLLHLCVFSFFFISSSSSSSLQCVGFISCVHLLRNEKEEGRKKVNL